ncbi:MAG: N-acetylmuramoyl-L-alanine amidase, partial [Oscillospiraceae bacterium]|nr:N-acetylmuramoyl-L-alanine amidase [Oscillospiraceae bacterium]
YKVAGGGWLRAEDVELLEEDHPAAGDVVFAGLARTPEEKGEAWLLEGPYSPLFRQERGEDGGLRLIFPACRFVGSLPPAGGLAAGAQLELLDGEDPTAGFALSFEFDPDAPLWGWAVEYTPEGVKITLRGRPELSGDPAAPLAGLTVLLDPGHGGTDNGTAGCAGHTGPLEQELNLLLAQTAKARLEQLGAQVALTRQDAANLTLAQRLERVNFLKPDLFISLHHNSVALTRDTADINGTECFWFTPQSRPLAAALTGRFAAAFGCRDRGAKEDYYFVTRTTVCPAVLLESGFLTTAAEYERCADETGLWAAGGAVAQAVEDFMAGR